MSRTIIKTLIILILVTACAPGQGAATPTIARPDRAATPQAQVGDAPAAATRIPLPSPTPTPTIAAVIEAPALPTTTPAPPQAQVIVSALNIRQGPGPDYPVIGVARSGDLLDVTGINNGGDWLQVVTKDGGYGWISGQMPHARLLGAAPQEVSVAPPPPPAAEKTESDASTGHNLGGKLIFMTGSGGELYAINLDGTNLRRLAGGVIDPAVSPDGAQVAFTRWDGAEFGALFVINVDGSGERVVLGDIRQPKSPAWSPDGKHIVISFQHGGQRDPGERCRNFGPGQDINIPKSGITITDVDVRGDGGVKICYIPFEDLQWHLRRIEVATGRFEDLPSDEYSYNPAWDPHNPWRVIYDGNWGLMQLDLTHGNRWPLTEDLRDTGPVFSPDGQMLALTYKQHDHWEVYTYNLQSGQRKRLTKPPVLAEPQYNSASPAWSPDGSHLAFVSDRSGRWEIWVMAADGSHPRPLLPPEIQAKLNLQYHGVNERMLNWVGE